MKRRGLFFLCAVIICGAASAGDIGLKAGSEFYIGDVTDTPVFQLAPFIEYAKRTGNFGLFLKGQYYLSFEKPVIQTGHTEEELFFYLPLPGKNGLIFSLDNQNDFHQDGEYDGTLEPAVQYNHDFGSGSLMAKFGYELNYGPEILNDNYIDVAYYGSPGFGFEFTYYWYYTDAILNEATAFEFLSSYTRKDVFYAEVEIDVNHDFSIVAVQPYIEFYVNTFTIWVEVDFLNIGKNRDLRIEPYAGFSYSF